MKKGCFITAVAEILEDDKRYARDAYQFVLEALNFTVGMSSGSSGSAGRNVGGRELLEGIRKYALREYGQTAQTVLQTWGIRRCEDFGNIVFSLVDKGVLRKTAEDSIHDFEGGYDFESAFRKPFLPKAECSAIG